MHVLYLRGASFRFYFGVMLAVVALGSPPSNRFCEVCDGSSGFKGVTVGVYTGDSKIRCSLRCHKMEECQLASYNEGSKVCTLLTNVTQDCTEKTTDLQLMDEADIIPAPPTTTSTTLETTSPFNASVAATSETTSLFNVSTASTSETTSPFNVSVASTTDISSSSAQQSTMTSTSMGVGAAIHLHTTTLPALSSSTSPPTNLSTASWALAFSYTSSQNGTQLPNVNDFLLSAVRGLDMNLLVSTSTQEILLPIEWFKVTYFASEMCVKNFAFYLYVFSKARNSINSLCLSSDALMEYAWPEQTGLPITMTRTPILSASIFTRDTLAGYHFIKESLNNDELGEIELLIRNGYDMRFREEGEKIYTADVVYLSEDSGRMFGLVRKAGRTDSGGEFLTFFHILHSIDGNIRKLQQSEDGSISIQHSKPLTEILFLRQWRRVYSVSAASAISNGSFTDLQTELRAGHRVKVLTGDGLSAKVDTVVELPGEDRILAIIVEEFLQSNGSFRKANGGFMKIWREIDTTGTERRVVLDVDGDVQSEETVNLDVDWFVDSDNWSPSHVSHSHTATGDTTLLIQAVRGGSRVRLQYRDPGHKDNPRVFLDTLTVTVTGLNVEAKTTKTLLYDYNSGSNMFTEKTEFMHWLFSTAGYSIRYLRMVGGSFTDSASSFVGAYEVTWYTN